MIYAMHQTKVACLVRHGQSSAWHQHLLRRLASEQLLLASSTTEGQGGGDVRNSAAPIERNGSRISLERQATVISYGAGRRRHRHDRAALGRCARVPIRFSSPSSKQDYTLEPLSGWDAFGMRGTCSEGFKLVASGSSEQILPVSYDKIHAQTMMPVAHLLWSAAWAGIAAAAVDARPRFRPQGRAPRRRHAAAGRRASDARQCFAAHAAQPHRNVAATVRGGLGRSAGARNHRFSDRHEPAQGQCLGACRRDGDERDADLRACRAIATTASSASAGICATFCRRRS